MFAPPYIARGAVTTPTISLKLGSGRITMLRAEASSTSQSIRFVSVRPRDPLKFSVDPSQDVDDWTAEFEWVSNYNGWDNTMKLANVIFYLAGTT